MLCLDEPSFDMNVNRQRGGPMGGVGILLGSGCDVGVLQGCGRWWSGGLRGGGGEDMRQR